MHDKHLLAVRYSGKLCVKHVAQFELAPEHLLIMSTFIERAYND